MIMPAELAEARNQIRAALENQTKVMERVAKALERMAVALDIVAITTPGTEVDGDQSALMRSVLKEGKTLVEAGNDLVANAGRP